MVLKFARAGVLALAAVAMAPQAYAEGAFNMANEYADSSFQAEGDRYFIERVRELTDGSVDIKYFPGGGLGYKSVDHFNAVGDAAIDIANTFIGTLSGNDPLFLLPSQPFLVQSESDAKALEGVLAPHYDKIFGDAGQVYLFSSPWPASGLWSRNNLETAAELEGLKVRVADANATMVFQAAGAAPLQLSWADVVPQLSTNAIDAVVTSAEGGVNSKFWEYMPHFIAINYVTPVNVVHMNRDAFEALTPEEQSAIRQAASETAARQWGSLLERLSQNYATLRENGVTVTEDVPESVMGPLREAAKVSLDDWLGKTGDQGREILSAYEAARK